MTQPITPTFDPNRPKQAFKWLGSKVGLAPWYAQFIPAHTRWVDVCCGSAAMTIAKTPSPVEILNDLDGHIINFFRVLMDSEAAPELFHKIANSVASRELHDEAKRALNKGEWNGAVDRAWMFWFKQWAGAPMNTTTFMLPKAEARKNPPHAVPDILIEFRNRLQECYLENRGAVEMILRVNEADTCIFIDPPYENTNSNGYNKIGGGNLHAELVQVLLGFKGKAMLCGYDNPRYSVLVDAGWARHEKEVNAMSSNFAKGAGDATRTEVLWVKSWNNGEAAPAPVQAGGLL